ncbi:rhodanese-like domain-containing protein [Photobacterium swingsii]|uniref:rhodanese-like domain-containing protein n=1 Tax=Photobacterium swingsii TaxID=680026 RepID=UPI00354BA73D
MNTVRKVLVPVIVFSSFGLQAMTFDQLSKNLDESTQVIDCRSSNYYNGWPEIGAKQGGHYPGAVNLDAQWLGMIEDSAFKQLLVDKQLKADQPTYLYCAQADSQRVEKALLSQGFSSVKAIEEPLSNYSGSLTALPQFQQLVSPEWVKQVIDGQQPLYAPKKGYKLVEVAWGPPTKYLVSHIPTALYLNTNNIETKPLWNRVSNEKLTTLMQDLGIRYDTTVILYGRDNMAAARAASIMMYAGVEDVRLLNGGWKSWVNAGFASEPMLQKTDKVMDFGRDIPANPELIIDMAEVKAILDGAPQNNSLVSIRSWDEYLGKISGYHYIKPKGRIPGAKWGHGGSDANSLEDFRNPDDTMKSADEIEHFWHQWEIDRDQKVSFYCGTGWRASETFFYAYVMGWKDISVYDGGWYEWSGIKTNPTLVGPA